MRPVIVMLNYSRSAAFLLAAVPFEEDAQNPQIWFVDHSYMENMFAMFRKVNGKCAMKMPTVCKQERRDIMSVARANQTL